MRRITDEELQQAVGWYEAGMTLKDAARLLNVNYSSLVRKANLYGDLSEHPRKRQRPFRQKGLPWLEEQLKTRPQGTLCWEWPFGKDGSGYGITSKGRAHVLALTMVKGEGVGLNALHICGNKGCVNPQHLYWGTIKENSADAKRHGTFDIESAHKAVKAKGFVKNQYGVFPLREDAYE